jgi:hypothetical protein
VAEIILVMEPLTPEMTSVGAAFVRALDESGFVAKAAFWLFDPEWTGWKLVLGSPELPIVGPAPLYRKTIKVLDRLGRPEPLRPELITILDTRNPIIQALATEFSTGPGIGGVRLPRTTINGVYIPGAYIYRVDVRRVRARAARRSHART